MSRQKIVTFDAETDPFKRNRIPLPFVWGAYDGTIFEHYWGDDCTDWMGNYLEGLDPGTIAYVHNGGRFDFYFILERLRGAVRIVNRSILEAQIGETIIRDSYAIIPAPLAKFKGKSSQKLDIDYDKMEEDVRELHRTEIIHYLRADCITLYEGVEAFHKEFGVKLTIGGTAMSELQKLHSFEKSRAVLITTQESPVAINEFDKRYREFYFGGRCQAFLTGVHRGDWKVYDVNSLYPDRMAKVKHPISISASRERRISRRTNFACIEARNDGALPMRTRNGLDFTVPHGTFMASIHEIEAGEDTGTLKIEKVHYAVAFDRVADFSEFVERFVKKKIQAELDGDQLLRLFYKLLLNSSYGKFAQFPEDYCEYLIAHYSADQPEGYLFSEKINQLVLWEKPTEELEYYNVATAASITGAARAYLLRGIAAAQRPAYCDTDSIICEGLALAPSSFHDTELGAWKTEASGDLLAVAGKKLYALTAGGVGVKKAHKGSKLTYAQIERVARGEIIEFESEVPNFKRESGGKNVISRGSINAAFVNRKIRFTGTDAGAEE